jgi:hypothetical protein
VGHGQLVKVGQQRPGAMVIWRRVHLLVFILH